ASLAAAGGLPDIPGPPQPPGAQPAPSWHTDHHTHQHATHRPGPRNAGPMSAQQPNIVVFFWDIARGVDPAGSTPQTTTWGQRRLPPVDSERARTTDLVNLHATTHPRTRPLLRAESAFGSWDGSSRSADVSPTVTATKGWRSLYLLIAESMVNALRR